MKIDVLMVNSSHRNCGVHQYGKRLYSIIKKSDKVTYDYHEIDNLEQYHTCLSSKPYCAVLYNYHGTTLPWLNDWTIQKIIPNIGISHESITSLWDISINIDTYRPESDYCYNIPRPLLESMEEELPITVDPETRKFIEYGHNQNKPIIGSFGFGFEFKGFDKIIQKVNEQYDQAIVKLLITHAHFDPRPSNLYVIDTCQKINKKPGIDVVCSSVFLTDHEVHCFLKGNTINLFHYDTLPGRSSSSAIDHAISAGKPIGISTSDMFRHIYKEDICLQYRSIQQCIENSQSYVDELRELWSNRKLIDKMDFIMGLAV